MIYFTRLERKLQKESEVVKLAADIEFEREHREQ